MFADADGGDRLSRDHIFRQTVLYGGSGNWEGSAADGIASLTDGRGSVRAEQRERRPGRSATQRSADLG